MGKFKVLMLFCAVLFFISGCGYSQNDLDAEYEAGYEDGYAEGKEDVIEEYHRSTVSKELYDESWNEGYIAGLYDGYQERKTDEEAGAPDQYEDYDEWFYFWYGIYPEDVKFGETS